MELDRPAQQSAARDRVKKRGACAVALGCMRTEIIMRACLALTMLLMFPVSGGTWTSARWTYQAMYEKADLVVIAKPVSVSQSDETTALPNVSPKMQFHELKTVLLVSVALKGANPEHLELRHVKLADPYQFALAGPSLVRFDLAERHSYLMFLTHEQGASYSPVTGQTDAAAAIIKLEGNVQ